MKMSPMHHRVWQYLQKRDKNSKVCMSNVLDQEDLGESYKEKRNCRWKHNLYKENFKKGV